MTLTGKELAKLLEQNGWTLVRITGSHHHYRKGEILITVAVHGNKAIPAGTLNAILKQAGLK